MSLPPPSRRFVRPYALVGGRTRASSGDIPIEAIIVTTNHGAEVAGRLRFEHRDIVWMCADPCTLAEVASHLRVPLGVARVLVGDLAANQLVDVRVAVAADDQPDIGLIERVLDGLRAL